MLTKKTPVLPNASQVIPSQSEESIIAQKRMDDVLLMLEHLIEREEATVKVILDCLYDVGSVNLINKKFSRRPVRGLMKHIARLSKPAFKVFALYWFKKNCPQLITNWLYRKVKF